MPSQNSCALELKPQTALRADVPLTGAVERERLPCFSGQAESPALVLHFPPATLAPERIDTSRTCLVTVDLGERTAVLTTRIVAVRDEQTLDCVIEQIDWHSQARGYFRVAANTRVAASSVIPEELARELLHEREEYAKTQIPGNQHQVGVTAGFRLQAAGEGFSHGFCASSSLTA